MTDLDRNLRWVRVSLIFFGVPLVGSLILLGLGPALAQVLPVPPSVLEAIAAITGVAALVTIFFGWSADRRVLRNQERELLERSNELALKHQELEATQAQHMLQLKLKEQERAIAVCEERIKVRELEHALAMRDVQNGTTEEDQPSATSQSPRVRREAPTALKRERRVLIEPDSAGSVLASDSTLAADSEQELAPVPDVVK